MLNFKREAIVNCDFLIAFDRWFCLSLLSKQNKIQAGEDEVGSLVQTVQFFLNFSRAKATYMPCQSQYLNLSVKLKEDPNLYNADYKIK